MYLLVRLPTGSVNLRRGWRLEKLVEPLSIAVNYALKVDLPSSGGIDACAQGILRRIDL